MTLAQDFKRLPPEGKSIDTTVRAGLERRVSDIQGRVNVVAKTSQDISLVHFALECAYLLYRTLAEAHFALTIY